MDTRNLDYKKIYIITSVIAAILFFMPMFTFSYLFGETSISGIQVVMGYKRTSGNGYYYDSAPLFIILLVIPIVVFLLAMQKEYSLKAISQITLCLSITEILICFYGLREVKRFVEEEGGRYDMEFGFYIMVMDVAAMIIASLLELYNESGGAGKKYELEEPDDIFGDGTPTQTINGYTRKTHNYIYVCYSCRKVFALSGEYDMLCPFCRESMTQMDVFEEEWETMSAQEKRDTLKKNQFAGIREV